MCPGLTSAGGLVAPNVFNKHIIHIFKVPAGEIVGIYIEGKENAIAIGVMNMSSDAIIKENKGIAINTLHTLGDALWLLHDLKKK
jgi:PUA domain protein